MTREDFIAQAAATFYERQAFSSSYKRGGLQVDHAIDQAEALADALESKGVAPWGRASLPDLGFMSVGMIQIGPGPAALKNILGDLAAKYPPETAVPAGSWELGFKPVPPERLKSGIIVPGRA